MSLTISEAAPGTSSGFAGMAYHTVLSRGLRRRWWRRVAPVNCFNCSGETLLMNFGLRQVGMFIGLGLLSMFAGPAAGRSRMKRWM